MRYLLDTNVVSNPAAITPNPRIVRMLTLHGAACALPAPVWHELVYGCKRMPRGEKRRRLEHYVNDVVRPVYPVLAYDEAAAAWHAIERARLDHAGRPAPFVDGQIAAIAATNDLVLVTQNRKDFSAFHGLPIDDWS